MKLTRKSRRIGDLLAITLIALAPLSGWANEIALTFDDAPRGSTYLTGEERTRKLLQALKAVAVPQAAFYCITQRFDPAGAKRVQSYAQAGHLVANHTHTHPSLNKAEPASFIEDIQKADAILRPWLNFRPWFRFPFLHEGKTAEHRDAVRAKLSELGYQNGYVTVDNYDWFMDDLLQEAASEGKKINFDRLEEIYIETLWSGIQFYDGIARQVLGRSPKHVLLLHENDLAAMYVGSLVKKLRSQSWKIISPDEAYTDPIAREAPDTLRNGQGRIVSIALTRGYQGPIAHESEDEETLRAAFQQRRIFE